jgi:hypothetical protein
VTRIAACGGGRQRASCGRTHTSRRRERGWIGSFQPTVCRSKTVTRFPNRPHGPDGPAIDVRIPGRFSRTSSRLFDCFLWLTVRFLIEPERRVAHDQRGRPDVNDTIIRPTIGRPTHWHSGHARGATQATLHRRVRCGRSHESSNATGEDERSREDASRGNCVEAARAILERVVLVTSLWPGRRSL